MQIIGEQGSNYQRKKAWANENLLTFVSQQKQKKLEQTLINSAGNRDFLKNLKNLEKDLCGYLLIKQWIYEKLFTAIPFNPRSNG